MEPHSTPQHHHPLHYEEGGAGLTHPSQPDPNSPSSTFSFPTLNLDGSLPDLSINSPSKPYQTTPPAALSTLAVKTKMAETPNDSLSDASLDAQYDMIDDISDISADDHETASLLSTRDDDNDPSAQLTPEGSLVDVREERRSPQEGRVRAENDLIDSYLSEDLETPRQSTVKSSSHRSTTFASQDPTDTPVTSPSHRILFISDPRVTDHTAAQVCLRIASFLLPEGESMDTTMSRVTRLPQGSLEPRDSPALHVRVGLAEMCVDRCDGITFSSRDTKYGFGALRFRDQLHGYAVPCSDLQRYDLIVYYLHSESAPYWFPSIQRILDGLAPFAITLAAPGAGCEKMQTMDTDLVLTDEKFFHQDDAELRSTFKRHLLGDGHSHVEQLSRVIEPGGCGHLTRGEKVLYNKFGILLPFRNGFGWTTLLPLLAILVAVIIKPYLDLHDAVDPSSQVMLRREALDIAWVKTTDSTTGGGAFNISHLLPFPESPWPTNGLFPPQVRSQRTTNDHILVSLPQDAKSRRFPTVTSTHVQKRGSRLPFNQTELIKGVYDITIHPEDASGMILVTMDTKDPVINVIAELNFGSDFYRKKVDKTSKEVGQALRRDVAVARKNAKTLRDKIALELTAGAAATKNVTTELSVYLTRDLQVLANTAVSVFAKAASASKESAASLKKEVAVIRKDLLKLRDDSQKSLVSTAGVIKALMPTRMAVKQRLRMSQARAHRIKNLLIGRKDTNSTSATKELSLRLRQFLKPIEKGREIGSLVDIARCSRAQNYAACRRLQKAQKAQKASESTRSAALQALSTATSLIPHVAAGAKTCDSKVDPNCRAQKKKPAGPKKPGKATKQHSKAVAEELKKNVRKPKNGPKKGKKLPAR